MKKLLATVVMSAAFGIASAQATLILVPNGDFSTPGGEDWNQAASGGSTITYQAVGGNTGGYGEIDATAGTWGGVLVSEGGLGPNPATGNGIPLATLGLTAGSAYDFQWDQIDLLGNAAIAGIKVESWAAGALISDSGDQLRPTNPTWTTEIFNYTIAPTADAVKVVMVQNQGFVTTNSQLGGITGWDNIGVDVIPEPSAIALLGMGALLIRFYRRRR